MKRRVPTCTGPVPGTAEPTCTEYPPPLRGGTGTGQPVARTILVATSRHEARSFVCLGPPRPKARPRVTPFGTFTPARTKQYERAIRGLAAATFGSSWDPSGQYRVTLVFASARPLAGDVDNYVKSVLDGLEGAAFVNDRQVVEVRARKAVEPGRGARTEVLVERVGDAMPAARKRKRKTRGPW